MRPNQLVRRLQQINPRTRVYWSPRKVSGLYFWQPKHPDARFGLRHIGAIASASWFFSMPEKDFFDEHGEYHRGWKSTVKLLGEQGHFSKESLTRAFGRSIWVPGIRGVISKLPGWGEPTRLERITKEMGLRPLAPGLR